MLRMIQRFACILLVALTVSSAHAAVNVVVNGSTYSIPQTNEKGWGANVTSWIQAVSSNSLWQTGGSFTLGADVDFGASFGLKSIYLKSRATNPAASGVLRLGNTESIGWRNAANSGNLLLSVDASDILTFNGNPLVSSTALTVSRALVSSASGLITASSVTSTELGRLSGVGSSVCGISDSCTLTSKTITAPVISTISNTGTLTLPTSTDTLVGRVTTDTLTGKSLSGSSNTFTNIPANTALTGAAPIANGGTGQATKAAAFDALSPMTASGDIIYGGTSGTGTALAKGSNGNVLTLASGLPSWASPSAAAQTVQSKTANYTALTTDDVILVNTNAVTITLYAASAGTKPLRVCKIGSDANLVTIARAGADTIVVNGTTVTSTVLHQGGECLTLTTDGASKFYLDKNERTERSSVTASAGPVCTIGSQSGSWLSGTTPTAAGDCTLTIASGIFSATPICVASPTDVSSGTTFLISARALASSSTSLKFQLSFMQNGSTTVSPAGSVNIICQGPR